MKKYFTISDIHGHYNLMMKALDEAGFDKNNENHVLISCGDLLDRGKQPLECLKFVNELPKDRKILIRGNHEDLFVECCDRREFKSHDYHNGTAETIMDLCSGDCKDEKDVFRTALNNPEWVKYENSLVDYAVIGNYVFVHGWIPTKTEYIQSTGNKWYYTPVEKKVVKWKKGNWAQARWKNPFEMWSNGLGLRGKTIVCGHWHTSEGHSKYHKQGSAFGKDACFDIFVDKGIIAIDACTAYSKKVNVFAFEVDEGTKDGAM